VLCCTTIFTGHVIIATFRETTLCCCNYILKVFIYHSFSFRGSIQNYKFYMDMDIAIFASEV
jgi:hypothetical protein